MRCVALRCRWVVNEDGSSLPPQQSPQQSPHGDDEPPASALVAESGAKLARGAPHKNACAPKAGRLVLFKARTVMHEVLPTHRKRFALTLWYFEGR